MINLDKLISEIQNDQEALIIFSMLGLPAQSKNFFEKLGGAKNILHKTIETWIKHESFSFNQKKLLSEFRSRLDHFYERDGFLFSQSKSNHCKLFSQKKSPIIFYARQQEKNFSTNSNIAIVGARDATNRALEHTYFLSKSLAKKNIQIVSGAAHGVDMKAHQGAIDGGGISTAVLGSCCDFIKDERPNRAAAFDNSRFLFFTPFGPFTKIGRHLFVERNFFIVLMSKALIVVQGKKGSGTLHTARFAYHLGIPIYAIPGPIGEEHSFAPNFLIKKGIAQCVIDLDELVENFSKQFGSEGSVDATQEKHEKVEAEKIKIQDPLVIKILKEHGPALAIEELIALTQMDFTDLQRKLMTYEINGWVRRRGCQFVLADC